MLDKTNEIHSSTDQKQNLKSKLYDLEGSINQLSTELQLHNISNSELDKNNDSIYNYLKDEKERMRNLFYKEIKHINAQINSEISIQEQNIKTLESQLLNHQSEKGKLLNLINDLKERIVDLEVQVGQRKVK